MRNLLLKLAISLICLTLPISAFANELNPKIQIAILLDSSNSMDGLIDQTRSQIWQVINTLTEVKKDGKVPVLEIALYHYGNDSLPPSEGYNRLLNGFTPELDLVSEQLFGIRTNGGQEYAGWVIQSATRQLQWSKNQSDFRAVFIAGNEPFNQGSISWQEAIAQAKNQDILVNTIYCGHAENRERSLWAQGAELASGVNFNINQNRIVRVIETPYDAEIIELNDRLNETYLPYGEEGEIGQQRQVAEDANAGEQLATRGAAKVSDYYRNSSWDLIDALEENLITLEDLAAKDLPANMRGMSLEERRAYINAVKAKRELIQSEIRELSDRRQAYLDDSVTSPQPQDTLHYVIIQALQQQLQAKGFTFE